MGRMGEHLPLSRPLTSGQDSKPTVPWVPPSRPEERKPVLTAAPPPAHAPEVHPALLGRRYGSR